MPLTLSAEILAAPDLSTTDSHHATKLLVEFLVDSLWPAALVIKNKLSVLHETMSGNLEALAGTSSVFALCCSQIHKCVLHLIEIFQLEHRNNILMQESRDCTIERMSWCLTKLHLVQKTLDELSQSSFNGLNEDHILVNDELSESCDDSNDADNSIMMNPMYFVNWIDQSLEILTNLSTTVYTNNYNVSMELFDTWKNEVIDSVSGLHTSIDELLLAAMTLCRHCLPADQPILTARCHVVLRETKSLISEIIEGDIDSAYKVTKDSLKYPLKPTNINVLIDVLKDALYILETNTNTALLALLVHCFRTPLAPLDDMLLHFSKGSKGSCPCKGNEDVDDCFFVKEFDFYNERLIQIGGFSISCSSDENRILTLRSALASLEALDPHLVPATLLAPGTPHTDFLTTAWRREVMQIRASIFLIVDPAAFSERAKETMNKKLLELIKGKKYINSDVCAVINLGQIVSDFFSTYNSEEPEAVAQLDRLKPLLADLQKVLKECKTVSDISSTIAGDFLYETVKSKKKSKDITFEQLLKRLKLLFTIVNRINDLFHCNEGNVNNFLGDECNTNSNYTKNVTHTLNTASTAGAREKVCTKQFGRYADNISKMMFARDGSCNQNSSKKCIISKITKHLHHKKIKEQLSFSVQLDELFNDISKYTENTNHTEKGKIGPEKNEGIFSCNKNLSRVKNTSILYDVPLGSNRESLRKVVLRKKFMNLTEQSSKTPHLIKSSGEMELEMSEDVMDSTTNLQITEILDQLSNFSKILDLTPEAVNKKTVINIDGNSTYVSETPTDTNILTLSVNGCTANDQMAKSVWRIPVNSSSLDDTRPSEISGSSTQSNVTTLERLCDIDLLDNRLNQLMSSNV